jgi:antitoxin HicB
MKRIVNAGHPASPGARKSSENQTAMLSYPVKMERDTNNTYLVTFPDIPEAVSVGDDEDEALLNALDALESAIEIYFDEKREVPPPSKPKKGQPVVKLPALVVSKVLLANEMIRQGIRKSELARRLDVHMPQIDRLLDPRHSSKLDAIEAAFAKLGKQLDVSIS